MNRLEFHDLLRRYLNDQCAAEERRLMDHLYELAGADRSAPDLSDAEELEERMWLKIAAQTTVERPAEPAVRRRFWTIERRWSAVAAAIALLIAAVWFFRSEYRAARAPEAFNETNWREVVNDGKQAMVVATDDHSRIALQPGARLRFPPSFEGAEKREVWLSGEAFFEVARNPNAPFFVHAENLVTQVLGTSFWVRNAGDGKQVSVEVVSGKVSVFRKRQNEAEKHTEGVVLTPNLKVTYYEEAAHFVTGIVAKPALIQAESAENTDAPPPALRFNFDETPLAEVISRLEQGYGIQIEVARESLKNCPITADLSEEPLFSKLEMICTALGARYEVKGTTILISGKGCD